MIAKTVSRKKRKVTGRVKRPKAADVLVLKIVRGVTARLGDLVVTKACALHLIGENRRLIEKIHNLEAERLIQDRLIKQLQARPEAAR